VPQRNIRSIDDVLTLLDGLFAPDADRWSTAGSDWWDQFYADRDRDVPFFVAKPDESLAEHLAGRLRTPGRALDLGCGPAATRCTWRPRAGRWTPWTSRRRPSRGHANGRPAPR
jgi:hypothetical protein